MITKTRLKELIIQNATIYGNGFGEIELIPDNDISIYENGNNGYILYVLEPNKKYKNEIFDEDLFETKEEAEFALKYKKIERTDTLDLPTWEEFDEQKFVWFVDKNQKQCCLYYINCTNKIFINVNGYVVNIGELNKENYLKACEVAKKLFLGE